MYFHRNCISMMNMTMKNVMTIGPKNIRSVKRCSLFTRR